MIAKYNLFHVPAVTENANRQRKKLSVVGVDESGSWEKSFGQRADESAWEAMETSEGLTIWEWKDTWKDAYTFTRLHWKTWAIFSLAWSERAPAVPIKASDSIHWQSDRAHSRTCCMFHFLSCYHFSSDISILIDSDVLNLN